MNKIFNIDLNKLAILLLPLALRKAMVVALTRAFVAPLISLYYTFIQKRSKDLYSLTHNGQVCKLRAALNDNFDVEDRRIKIVDANSFKRTYLYTRGEEKPTWLGTTYIYERSDYGDTGVDFIVKVPRSTYDQHRMEALIDYYRLASKRYKIVQV